MNDKYLTCETCGHEQRPGATVPETQYFGLDESGQANGVAYPHSSRFAEAEPCLNCGARLNERQGTAYWGAESWQYEQSPDRVEYD